MLVSVLASGSKGNSCLIKTSGANILIDFGMSTKYTKERLMDFDTNLEDIDYILITHSHKDHTAGLKTFIKKYKTKIFISPKMLEDLPFLKDYDNLVLTNKPFEINGTSIDFFKTSHDTSDSRGFIIEDNSSSMVYITDTGYINQKNFHKLENKNLYVLESNHDVEMLMEGPYPDFLKQRVLSDVGHLSNNACAFYLSKLIGDKTKTVILAHLSEKNNKEEVALKTIYETFSEYEVDFDNIIVAKQNVATEGIIIW